MEQQISKHEKRRLKLDQRQQDKLNQQQNIEKKEKTKTMETYGIVDIIVLAIAAAGFFIFTAPQQQQNLNIGLLVFPLGSIHWHAIPIIEICGEQRAFQVPASNQHLGSNLLHTHQDAKIHVEGIVSTPSQITLGLFFDNIGVKFSQTEIMDKKNGDTCPNGKTGELTMTVNGIPNTEFRDYLVKDGDAIQIKFE